MKNKISEKYKYSFDTIYESIMTRYATGCFFPGDIIAFDMKNIQKHPDYKSLTQQIKSQLDHMMMTQNSGENVIIITAVNNAMQNSYEPATLTIAYSHGGGRWVEPITIPGSLCEFITRIEEGVNLNNKIPNSAKVTYTSDIRPKEVDLEKLEKERTRTTVPSTVHGV